MGTTDKQVIGYSEGQGIDFTAYCLACVKDGSVDPAGGKPIYADDVCDFEGKDPGCYECGEAIFDAPEWTAEDELTERRREYHNMIERDCRRLGLL